MKNRFFITGILVLLLVFGMMSVGCATTQHNVEISNVQNIREIYIRNTGTTNWGNNMVKDLQNIDISKYSERVDIRVVDSNNIIYSKNNIPFSTASFVETNKTSSFNTYALGGLGLVLLVVGLLVL